MKAPADRFIIKHRNGFRSLEEAANCGIRPTRPWAVIERATGRVVWTGKTYEGVKQTRVIRSTWQGRPATQTIHYFAGPVGLRVVEHQWADEPTARVSVVDGDGRDLRCREYLHIEGVEPGQGAALAAAL